MMRMLFIVWDNSIHEKLSVQGIGIVVDWHTDKKYSILAGKEYGTVILREEEKTAGNSGALELKFDGKQLYWDEENEMYSREKHE